MEDTFFQLTTKYLSKEATENDIQRLSAILESNKELQQKFYELAKSWNSAESLSSTSFDTEEAKQKILLDILGKNNQLQSPKVKRFNGVIKIAAVFTLALCTYFILFNNVFKDAEWKEFRSGDNEKLQILLPDRSKVWLNENTTLAYNFSNPTIRQLELNGEAYFEVARDEKRPFVVVNPFFTTKVLGTSFNINSKGLEEASLSVLSGKVTVGENGNEAIYLVEKGDQVHYNKKKEILEKKRSLAIDNEMAWVDHKFVFENLRLGKVVNYLSKNYGVTFKFTNENLKNCLITATFHKKNIKNIMSVICTSLDCEYSRMGNNVILLSGNGCQK